MKPDPGAPAVASAKTSARPLKHSFALSGHRTSISLEAAFWDALRNAAKAEGMSLAALVGRIDRARGGAGLSSAIRVWVLDHVRRNAGAGQTQAIAGPSAGPVASASLNPRSAASGPKERPD